LDDLEAKCRRVSVRPIGTKMMPLTRRTLSTGVHVRKIAAQSKKKIPATSLSGEELLKKCSFSAGA